MAKTFKLNVSFPMSLVVHTETVKDFTETRGEAREILARGTALKGETKFRVELLASDKTDDEVLETIFRAGIRQVLREDFLKGVCGDESRGRLGDVKVTFETPMVPRSCDRCTQEACFHPNRIANIGCELKRTGLREACGGPRWTETV
jgi:hypothetical protein